MIDNHCHAFTLPKGAAQTSVGDAAYAPPQVDVWDHAAHLAELGCDRGVLVQPSAYGTDDHAVLLASLRARPDVLRGVACVPVGTPTARLQELHDAGVRATRVQDGYPGGVPVGALGAVAEMVGPLGWHIEVWTDLRRWVADLPELVREAGVPVVIDHLGYVPSDHGIDSPAVSLLLDLLAAERCWVTLSGLDRLYPVEAPTPGEPGFARAWEEHEERVAERVAACVAAAPDRVLWGSDWPHVGLQLPHPGPDRLLDRLHRWLPDAEQRRAVCEDNPSRLYGFKTGESR
ncbi:amidohydrolase family protein [Mariniluteicoccus endophyticus]